MTGVLFLFSGALFIISIVLGIQVYADVRSKVTEKDHSDISAKFGLEFAVWGSAISVETRRKYLLSGGMLAAALLFLGIVLAIERYSITPLAAILGSIAVGYSVGRDLLKHRTQL